MVGSRTVEASRPAGESTAYSPEKSSQMVLEPLRGTLPVTSGNSRISGLFGSPWDSLVCAAMVVFIVKSQHTLRRGKELAKRCCAWVEAYEKGVKKTGLGAPGWFSR